MNKKKKIVRITTVPISLNVLLKGQLKFINQYYEVIAVSSSGDQLKEVGGREGVRTYPLEMTRKITPLKDICSIISLFQFLKKEKPYIIHSHTPKAGLIAMIAAFFARVPNRLHTVSGLPLMETNGLKRFILLVVEKLIYALSTVVLPNSYGIRNFILENNLTNKSKLCLIGKGSSNGIDLNFFQPSEDIKHKSSLLKIEYNLEHKFIYLYIGRLVSHKGINELVNSFIEMNEKCPDTILILVGEFENDLDPLSALTRIRMQIANIKCVGYQKDVRPFLALADVFVFPSYREGFPNAVLQACAFNLPCIVSDISGCNEIIQNHKNGLIVPPKNEKELTKAMQLLYTDEFLLNKLGRLNRLRVEAEFGQTFVWNEILNLYNSI